MKKVGLLVILLFAGAIAWAVPSGINYQGRLTNSQNVPETGSKTMEVRLYDASTGGNEIYYEEVGTVNLDTNGVYSFQFGASGQSVVDVEEVIAITAGSTKTYTGSLSSTPLEGTLSVSDGNYSWNITAGNPGRQAVATAQVVNGFVVGIVVNDAGEAYSPSSPPSVTVTGSGSGAVAVAVVSTNGTITAINVTSAGSGYGSSTTTITIDSPPSPYQVYYDTNGVVSVIYEPAPAAYTKIIATYEAKEGSLSGALAKSSDCWLELSIDGVAQDSREKILTVPYATYAKELLDSGIPKTVDVNYMPTSRSTDPSYGILPAYVSNTSTYYYYHFMNLPTGSTIRNITANFRQNSASYSSTLYFYRKSQLNSSTEQLGYISNITQTTPQDYTLNPDHVIEDGYTYYIQVYLRYGYLNSLKYTYE